ncbi:glycosyltransferase family 4 protein [Candidatus Pacearchaeota archaeon]|nr:glycosyltransferase family 4 protein [Candidatus Pacearchaeota archaeon]
MRIGIDFHTNDIYVSGVERYSLGLINALLRTDRQNAYVIFTNQPNLVAENVPASKRLRIRDVNYLGTRAGRILWQHTRLPLLARKEGLDLLHCPHYICPCFDAGVPYVVTVHDTIALDNPQWCKVTNILYFRLMMGLTIKRASRIITVSQCTASSLNRHFPDVGSRVGTVYPGVEEIFNGEKSHRHQNRVRSKYDLPEAYVLFVGNIEPKKNVMQLLRAFKLARQRGIPHKLVLVGKRTWKSKDVWQCIRHQVRAGNVILTGYVKQQDLPYVYQMADVFVFASLYEGFGFPPLEAMACGTPVIASTSGALKETMGTASYTVDPTDHHSIAEAIYLLITHKKVRQKYIELGKEQSRRFCWDKAAEQTRSIYQEVVGGNQNNA